MNSFNLLSNKVKKKIWDMNWTSLSTIQDLAIENIINTSKDIILSSGTASGKTEAAFLPILSLIEQSAKEELKVIYISPLKALINNQFERMTLLCNELSIHIQKWHGDVSSTNKKSFLKKPHGILQITPESIESLFVNHSEKLQSIFNNIDFIVIDEIHAFINNERGVQLRSLISRISTIAIVEPRIIGLSATIDNYGLVKAWINQKNPSNVEVLAVDTSDKSLKYSLYHFDKDEKNNIPLELIEDISYLTREQKTLIFSNSRSQVEELSVILNRFSIRNGDGEMYYPHHSSIDKAEREFVEKTVASSSIPKSIVATSSLELGIDIGSIDLVIQVDSTHTVSSLKQRLGRSGRKKGASQILQLYSTSKVSMMQSLAVMELVIEKWIEPAEGYKYPIDILFHQIISICKEKNGLKPNALLDKISEIPLLNLINFEHQVYLINSMLDRNILEEISGSGEFIVGIEGERLLRGKEFYAVFMTPQMYSVIYGTKVVGEILRTDLINEGDSIILAGKRWMIISIDKNLNKVYVNQTIDAKPPKYEGSLVNLHKKIPEKMFDILCSKQTFNYMNEFAKYTLQDLRKPYELYNVHSKQRVSWKLENHQLFEMYTGSIIVNTFNLLINAHLNRKVSCDPIAGIKLPLDFDLGSFLKTVKNTVWTKEMILEKIDDTNLIETKYTEYLPLKLRKEMHYEREYDMDALVEFIDEYELVCIDLT